MLLQAPVCVRILAVIYLKTLVISDLDGTLLKNDGTVSGNTRDMINAFTESGGYFSVATARSPATAVPILKGTDINAPSVMMNGVFIYDIKNRKSLKTFSLSEENACRVIDIFHRHGKAPFFFNFTGDYLNVQFEALNLDVHKRFYDDRKNSGFKRFEKVESMHTVAGAQPVYFSLVDRYEDIKPIYDEVTLINGVNAVIYKDTYTPYWYIEIFSELAGKKNGVEYIKAKFGFDRVIAFGDNLNDLPMFEAANESYAVANAHSKVKAAATGIIGTNENDAVARYLENIKLK